MMDSALGKIKRIRSLDEVVTRGGQALSVIREQRRGGHNIPSEQEFLRLIDAKYFGDAPVISESLWQKFYQNGQRRFFPSLIDPKAAATSFRKQFGDEAVSKAIAAAEKIAGGKIDLLGHKDLFIGFDVDWNREPLSGKRSPLRHWKAYDNLDVSETGDKKIIWELNRHQHFFTLGLAYSLTDDERFAEVFVRHLDSWMDQNPPGLGVNWSSSLELAFRAISWVWAFHFFKDSDHFTPELFKKALKFLHLHGRHIERYLSTYYSPNTHLTGEALALYYLGTQFPYFRRASEWRNAGANILFSEIEKQILPDGVYFEQSTWYQRYTVEFYLHFLVLHSLTGDEDPRTPALESRLKKALEFMAQITQPDGRTPLIGDDDGGRLLPLTNADPDDFRGVVALGATVLGRGDLKYVAGDASHEIYWLLGEEGLARYNEIQPIVPDQGSKAFPDGGYYVMRDGFDKTDNCLVVDCGAVGSLSGGHGHADALSIVMALQGKPLLVDPGTYTYHESMELRDRFRATAAHNTLVVDRVSSSEPGNKFGWKSRADCVQTKWISEERFDLFEGSQDGYRRLTDPVVHTRSILFVKGDYWIIRDRVEAADEHQYSLNFHYSPDREPKLDDNANFIGDATHRMFTFGGNGEWRGSDSAVSVNHGSQTNAPMFSFRSTAAGPQDFITFILPVAFGVEPPKVVEFTNTEARTFEIRYAGYKDVFVVNGLSGSQSETELIATDFAASWIRFRDSEVLPDEFILIDGNHFHVGRHEVLNGDSVRFALGRRFGNELCIRTEAGLQKVSLAAKERRRSDRRGTSSDRRRQ